jgi:hypothetical protein
LVVHYEELAMLKLKQLIFGIAAASAIALLPMAPAMAGGHGFGPLHSFGLGRGVVGAAVALATLPLVIASAVVSGAESVAPYPSAGYAGAAYGYAPQVSYPGPRPYYAPYPGYYAPYAAHYAPNPGYYAAPRGYYGPRPYYAAHPGYYGRGYYRAGGSPYPHR